MRKRKVRVRAANCVTILCRLSLPSNAAIDSPHLEPRKKIRCVKVIQELLQHNVQDKEREACGDWSSRNTLVALVLPSALSTVALCFTEGPGRATEALYHQKRELRSQHCHYHVLAMRTRAIHKHCHTLGWDSNAWDDVCERLRLKDTDCIRKHNGRKASLKRHLCFALLEEKSSFIIKLLF